MCVHFYPSGEGYFLTHRRLAFERTLPGRASDRCEFTVGINSFGTVNGTMVVATGANESSAYLQEQVQIRRPQHGRAVVFKRCDTLVIVLHVDILALCPFFFSVS